MISLLGVERVFREVATNKSVVTATISRGGLAIRAACYRTEKAQIPQKCRGGCWEDCREEGDCWGDCQEQCWEATFFGKTEKRHCSQQSSFSWQSSQHSRRHSLGIRAFPKGPKIENIEDHPPGLKFSSEIRGRKST